MNTLELIVEAQSIGIRFELAGEGFKVVAPSGTVGPAQREGLAARKAEVIALLKQPEVSFIAGDCPHCRRPIEVRQHSARNEVWFRCPEGRLFKRFKQTSNEWCSDCGIKLSALAGRCIECLRRVMTAPDEACPICSGPRFWRYRASIEKPAGFAWYCAGCFAPFDKVALYELTGEEAKGVENLCQQPS
jgi:hypothetical protein